MSLQTYEKNETIFKVGDKGDKLGTQHLEKGAEQLDGWMFVAEVNGCRGPMVNNGPQ